VLFNGACAHLRTGSFTAGVALMDAIGRLADARGQRGVRGHLVGRD
jgi:hypothetical protein